MKKTAFFLGSLVVSVLAGCQSVVVGESGECYAGSDCVCDGDDCSASAIVATPPADDDDPPSDPPPDPSGNDGLAVPWPALGDAVAPAPDGTLLLVYGAEEPTCADPLEDHSCEVPFTWRVLIGLPSEYQVVGARVDLEDIDTYFMPLITESFVESPQDVNNGECSGGGGTLTGSLEVLAIDDATITVHVEGFTFDRADPSGDWVLARCPG
ncbi:MAG: hypothetical protein U0271_11480 [Polyangiaceae bacterium]